MSIFINKESKIRWNVIAMPILLGMLIATWQVRADLLDGGTGICKDWSNSTTGYAYPKETPRGTLCCEIVITGHQEVNLNNLQFGQNIREEICGKPYGESE